MSNLRRSVDSILGRDEVRKILDPFFDDLIESTNEGKAHYDTFSSHQLRPMRKRTKATMLNDSIVDAAVHRLEGEKGVAVDRNYETAFLVFEGRLALRFKKVHRNKTSNIRTDRQDNIDFHCLSLAGVEAPTVVTFGYSLNELWTSIVGVRVICYWGNRRLWTIPLIAGEQARTLPLDDLAVDQDGPTVRSTIPNKNNRKDGEQ